MSKQPDQDVPPRRRFWLLRRLLAWLLASAYHLTVRVAIYAATLLLLVYFVVNSPSTVRWAGELAAEAIPGRLSVGVLRWGPSPGSLRLGDVQLLDSDGVLVAAFGALHAEVAWLPLLGELLQLRVPQRVRVLRLDLEELTLRVEAGPDGELRLLRALIKAKEEPEPPSAARFDLAIDRIGLRGGRFGMDLNGTRIAVEQLGLQGDFALTVDGEQTMWSWSARELAAAHASIELASLRDNGLEQLPSGRVRVASAVGGPSAAQVVGVAVEGAHTTLERADVAVRWSPDLNVQVRRGVLRTRTPDEPFVGKMLGDSFAAAARFEGDVDFDAAGRTQVRGSVRGDGRMAGFDTRDVRADIEVEVPSAAGEVVAVRAKDVEIFAFGGKMTSERIGYRLGSDGLQRSEGRLQLAQVSIAEALQSPAIAMAPEQTLALLGVVDGRVDVDVGLRTNDPAGLWLDARTDLDLRVERDPRASLLRDALPTLALRGGIDAHMEPGATPKRPLWLALREVVLSDEADGSGPVRGGSATFVSADGSVDLDARTVALRGAVGVPKLGPMLRAAGVDGIDGGLQLDRLVVDGPMLSPRVDARLRLQRLAARGARIDELSTHLRFADGTLRLLGLRASLSQGNVAGDLALKLFDGSLDRPRKAIAVSGERVEIRNVELAPLLQASGVRGVAGKARVEHLRFALDLDRPAATLRADGKVTVDDLAVRHERFEKVEADMHFGGGAVDVRAFLVRVPPVLRRGEPPLGETVDLTGSAHIGLVRGDYRVEVQVPSVRFDQFGEVRQLAMPLHGTVEGTLRAAGNRRELALDADLQLRALAWDRIVMGDARIVVHKEADGPARLSSDKFFPRFSLRDGSVIAFRGLVPQVVSLQLTAERFDPFALLSLPPMAGITLYAAGDAELRLDFRPGQPIFSVEAKLPPGGVEIELQNGLDPIRNRLPAVVRVLPDRLELDSTELVFGTEAVALCGTFRYPDEANGLPSTMAFYLAGHVEVPRFGALAESLANLELGFDIGEDPVVAADPASACLNQGGAPRGALRIAGPLDALVPQGRIVLGASRVVPRGYGREILLAAGARIELSADARGQLVLKIPSKAAIEGRIDDSRFRLWGRTTLHGYTPDEVDVHFDGVDLAYAAPKEYALVATPRLRFVGKRLRSDDRDMLLSGDVLISEGQYSKSFDKLGKVIGGVRGRELEGYEAPLLERLPWLGAIRFDMAMRGQNFEVLSRFPFGRTDLELGLDVRVRGTLATPELFGRVDVLPGGVLTYSVVKREFEVTEGSIDFNGAVDKAFLSLEARTDVPLDLSTASGTSNSLGIGPNLNSNTTGQASKVTVTIRVTGPLDDPRRLQISLSSVPRFDPADIQSLILTGQLLTANGSGGALGSRTSINLLTDDLAEAFSKMLLSAFVDSVSIGIPASGGINAKVTTSLGRAMTLTGNVISDATGVESSATFALRLGERWSLEGLLRSVQPSGSQTINVYEAKLRYRVPLPE